MFNITLDPAKQLGTIRKLHGMNLAAPITQEGQCRKVSEYLKRIEVPQTRMHDCPLNNPGKELVDMHCIFPLEHLDADDPKNYFFGDTDDYFANTIGYGTTIYYRLGVSIDHSGFSRHTVPPADPEKWAKIACNIIRHYNEDWNNGFHYNIRYWEIWNEADTELPKLWKGTWKQFIDFYCTVSKILKKEFPHLLFGGPSMAKLNCREWTAVREFLAGVRDADAPLDFFTYHQYSDKQEKITSSPRIARDLLDEYGFKKAEIHLTEWHFHCGWGSDCVNQREAFLYGEMTGPHSAAYLASTLIRWQEEPIDMGHYYTGSTGGGYSLFDRLGNPLCGYYAFDFFNQTANLPRIEAVSENPDLDVLASSDGKIIRLLIAAFKAEQGDIRFRISGQKLSLEQCRITLVDVDGVKRQITREISSDGEFISFEKASGSVTCYVEITL